MYPRENKCDVSAKDGALEFQIVSWHTCDFEYSADDDDATVDDNERYLVKVFGVTTDGMSVGMNILNFTPFFFVKVTHRVDKMILERFREYMVTKLPCRLQNSLINVKLMKKKDFWGFHNGETFSFLRFTFKSLQGFKAGIRIMSKDIYIVGLHTQKRQYKLYESNIDPFLRLIHLRDIEPAGWVRVEDFEQNTHILPSKCQIDINVDWRKIHRPSIEKMAPMVVASFDIECVSSHGDFPVARKDYKKVAYEFFQLYEKKKTTVDELKEYMIQQLMGIFDKDFEGEMSKVFLREPLSAESLSKIATRVKRDMDDIINIASGQLVLRRLSDQARMKS
jgi:DNA polymerase elongation subunit (family B)